MKLKQSEPVAAPNLLREGQSKFTMRKPFLTLVCFWFVAYFGSTVASPNGPPASSCGSMTPGHGSAPQSVGTPSPYIITVDKTTVIGEIKYIKGYME